MKASEKHAIKVLLYFSCQSDTFSRSLRCPEVLLHRQSDAVCPSSSQIVEDAEYADCRVR